MVTNKLSIAFILFTLMLILSSLSKVGAKIHLKKNLLFNYVKTKVTYTSIEGKDTNFTGIANIVKIDQKLFIITSSHLTQGSKNLSFENYNNKLKYKDTNRIWNNDDDIELIELEEANGLIHIAEYDTTSNKFILNNYFAERLNQEVIKHSNKTNYWIIIPKWFNSTKDYLLFQSVYRLGLLEYANSSTIHDQFIEKEYIMLDFISNRHIAPIMLSKGLSGIPLITKTPYPNNSYKISGFMQSYLKDFYRTYFSTENALEKIVLQYKKGKRGNQGNSTWNYEGNILIRIFTDGTKESIVNDQTAGNAFEMDGGDKVYDSTDQTQGFIGKPGIVWNNSDVLAFKVKEENKSPYVLFANLSAYHYINKFLHKNNEVLPMEYSDGLFMQLFKEKLKTYLDDPFRPVSASERSKQILACRLNYSEDDHIIIDLDKASSDRNSDGHVTIKLDKNGHLLSIKNADLIYPTKNNFSLRIYFNSQNTKYYVDLTGLIASDISLFDSLTFKERNNMFSDFSRLRNRPYVFIRTNNYKDYFLKCDLH